MSSNVLYLIAGLSLLLAVVLPSLLERYAVSAAMVLLLVGAVIGRLPLPDGFSLDPVQIRPDIQHVTELTVLVALMGVGLAIDRPLRLLRRGSWAAWSPTWRLLGVAMPLTIAAMWGLGWALGVAPAAALLLASALAPTDPVLASDVQVEGPRVERADGQGDDDPVDDEIDEDDDVRFALTSEAGLNDGTAFPFVHLALLLAASGASAPLLARWAAWELVGKLVLGVLVGMAVGWVLAKVAFNASQRSLRLAEQGEPLLALAALIATYGLSEVVGGYGFVAVFVCGMTLRANERSSAYHELMHGVVQRLERLLTLMVLLLLGMAMSNGLLGAMDWRSVVIALALVLVVRPLAGWVALVVRPRPETVPGGLNRAERLATSFFGVRGVGCIFYLAYAAGEHEFAEERWMWSTLALTIVVSVFVHGILATPVMSRLEVRREEQATA
ncbi:sodium/proton antiporter (CPA1 family) [Terracoccus luteus]|uniref:Sodium/proton antiporter (CPA1 family) n=1 Tax=Terracoccus luteus TaxID=53356 RepID=A0A495Y1Q7_9MICO|nr:cation:proton antiporter [Terracoccus luteus]RKT79134.1 sodium/proton antiporter (CPA1 family) [Terracoccus luteus]